MNPIKKLRALFAILLVVSMLMPLSRCEHPGTVNALDQTNPQEQLVIDRYIVSENSTWSEYLWLLAFLAPGLMLLVWRHKPHSWISELSYILASLPVAFLLWFHNLTGTLALGGYVAMVAVVGLICISLMALGQIIKTKLV